MRPWTATAAAPASSTICASVGAFRSSSFQPARIFTVTGIFTAFAIAAMTVAACSGSRIRLQPALCFAIFGTGQPMLTSTMSAPMPSTICAAVGHLLRIAAEDLDRDRPLFLGVLGVLERAIDAAHQPLGAHHLGDDEAAAAVALDQAAERRVGHAGHRRDGERRREFDGADLHRVSVSMSWSSIRLHVRRVDFDRHGLADQIDRQHEPRACGVLPHQPADDAPQRAVRRLRPSSLRESADRDRTAARCPTSRRMLSSSYSGIGAGLPSNDTMLTTPVHFRIGSVSAGSKRAKQ